MCGRYTLQISHHPKLMALGLPLADRFNIAPQSEVLVIESEGEYALKPWDYSPSWAREPMRLTNARSETLREKPAFRKADRCVFVADTRGLRYCDPRSH
jgi:putative SOS response-associated peptidase YedK